MIRDTETQNTQAQANNAPAQATPRAQQEAPRMQQAAPQALQGGISGLPNMFKRSGRTDGGDARASEALQVMTRVGKDAIDHQDLENDFQILRFDRDANRVGYSALLIVKHAAGGNGIIVVRPLIMPNPAITLPPRQVTIQNGMSHDRFDVDVEVQDVFTVQYWNRICEFVRQTTGRPKAEVHPAGPLPIPAEFDLKDEVLLKDILIRSVNLCDDVLAKKAGETPFQIAMLRGQDETLAAKMDFSGRPVMDSVGNPIKSDIVISLNRTKKQGQQENEFYEADTMLNQVSVQVTLEYTPTPQAQMFGQQTQPLPPFSPAILVTDIRQANWIKANTLELYLFALSNAFRVTAGQAWARKFLPQVGKVKDLGDIGALGWLSNLGKKIDTKSDTFTDQNFADLMLSMVRPNPSFLIDLDRMGDNAALDVIFLDAMGGPNQQKATAAIIRAVQNLVGGGFERFFDFNTQPIIASTGTEVNKGYYWDGDEKRDRRDLDALGALNAAEGNQQEWMSWYGTQCNPNIHPELRNKQSKNYDRAFLGAVTYTTRAHRGIFNPKFIEGLDKAIAAAGLTVAMDNVAQVFGAQRFVGNTMIQDFAVGSTAQVVNGMGVGGGYQMNMVGSVGTLY
ncbi:hypothetical protein [Pseudomonas phage vB_PaeM_PS119XW]|uniref:Uncharacterized protein n=1 Tax=Pseudomonas phage vB_PaeM_PS119XW TaxID=2601632 RepID=A0A5C1K8D1_9CAUD|nr:nuclear shell protein [Pseudomonas phage vB_PaeM_PS119XW]QEM41783.1 hypothetical protein [Pseudomonas phage vB_PaeM_PS119XW]